MALEEPKFSGVEVTHKAEVNFTTEEDQGQEVEEDTEEDSIEDQIGMMLIETTE